MTEAPKLHTITPTAPTVSTSIVNATNKDTGRATRVMQDQMRKIIAGLEDEMTEAQEVRDVITKRIVDLHTAIRAAHASLEAMKEYG